MHRAPGGNARNALSHKQLTERKTAVGWQAPRPPNRPARDKGTDPPLQGQECPICYHAVAHAVRTDCGHQFCRGCLIAALQAKEACPLCRAPVSVEALAVGASAEHNKLAGVHPVTFSVHRECGELPDRMDLPDRSWWSVAVKYAAVPSLATKYQRNPRIIQKVVFRYDVANEYSTPTVCTKTSAPFKLVAVGADAPFVEVEVHMMPPYRPESFSKRADVGRGTSSFLVALHLK